MTPTNESKPLTVAMLSKLRRDLGYIPMPEEGGLLLNPSNPECYQAMCEEFGIDPTPPRVIDVWKEMVKSGGKYPKNLGKIK